MLFASRFFLNFNSVAISSRKVIELKSASHSSIVLPSGGWQSLWASQNQEQEGTKGGGGRARKMPRRPSRGGCPSMCCGGRCQVASAVEGENRLRRVNNTTGKLAENQGFDGSVRKKKRDIFSKK